MDHRRSALEWCLQPGVKLDFRHCRMDVATAKDVENELKRIGHTLSPLEIVWSIPRRGQYGRQIT